MREKVVIISPVYNEEDVIERFYQELKKHIRMLEVDYEFSITFVVDRCTDNTIDVLREIVSGDPSVQCLIMSSRFGHQMCLLAGIDYTKSDIYIMMDSDLQHPPAMIKNLLDTYKQGYDVVFTIRDEQGYNSYIRKYLGSLFYVILNRLSDATIYKNASDFRLITEKVAEKFRHQIRERNMFMRGLISWVGGEQKALVYDAAVRHAGKSKYSMARMFKLAIDAIISFSSFPLKLSLISGAMFSIAGFIYAAFTVYIYFVDTELPSGWSTLVILILLFSGVQLLCLGMIGTYIGAIYTEVKGRPHYIVDKVINCPGKIHDKE